MSLAQRIYIRQKINNNEQPRPKGRGIRTLRAVCRRVAEYILFLDFGRISLSCPHPRAFLRWKQNIHHSKIPHPKAVF